MQAKSLNLPAYAEWLVAPALLYWALSLDETSGLQSARMITHIALMTIVAPVLADRLRKRTCLATELASKASLLAATGLQATLFFAWHSPASPSMGGHGDGIMQGSLFLSSLWFWLAVLHQGDTHPWRAVVALLVTGKLFCLIAILLTFSPRVLPVSGIAASQPAMAAELADQQLAGLLMIIACPLTYVLVAIALIYRWFQLLCDAQGDEARTALASDDVS